MMSYCHLCQSLTIEKLFPPNIFHHATSVAALEKSGRTCRLCMFMHKYIDASGNPHSEFNPAPIGENSSAPQLIGDPVDRLAHDEAACKEDTKEVDQASQSEVIQSKDSLSVFTT